MTKIPLVVCSIFRDSTPYLDRYFGQMESLAKEYPNMHLALAEGDSVDNTYDGLLNYIGTSSRNHLLKVDHGGARYGSIDNDSRWDQIAQVVRPVRDLALSLSPQVVVWVESDLIWDTGVMVQLIDYAQRGLSVAPMVFASEPVHAASTDPNLGMPRFYDIWGFRMGGKMFSGFPPYFPSEPKPEGGLIKIDSCGSCFATKDLKALKNWTGHWPFRADGNLRLDPLLCVRHP